MIEIPALIFYPMLWLAAWGLGTIVGQVWSWLERR